MCCHHELYTTEREGCCCRGGSAGEDFPQTGWLSRKKKVEALKEYLGRLESRVEDVREYMCELEA